MRLLVQRVKRAVVREVTPAGGQELGAIGPGLVVLAGFGPTDAPDLPSTSVWRRLVEKVLGMRVFPDADGKLNLGLTDGDGGLLVVSQFTLYADCRRGRRPSFSQAARPEVARPLFDRLVEDFSAALPGRVGSGAFGADMEVELVNWGPVTIWLDGEDFA